MNDQAPKHKTHPADTAAEKWLSLQLKHSASAKKADLLLISLLGAFILAVAILIFLLPKPYKSENENRVLSNLPTFSVSSLCDGEFAEGLSDFYADRIPCRDLLIRLRSLTELAALRLECGGIMLGNGGYLIDRLEYGEGEYANLKQNFDSIERFAEKSGIDVTVTVMPRSIDVMKDALHPFFSTERAEAVYSHLPSYALTFDSLLYGRAASGEYVWYKTDHHFTTLGAYYVYAALGTELGYTPYPIDFFTQTTVSSDFLGTSYSAAGLPVISPDELTLFRYDGDDNYTVSYGEKVLQGFYDESFLSGKDKYSVFLGGNHALTSIKGKGERETLVVVKDSFSHALAPFLALHFDLELVDLRYYPSSVKRLCDEVNADRLLVLCGIDSLASAPDLRRLEQGLYS